MSELYHNKKRHPSGPKEAARSFAYMQVQRQPMFKGYHIVIASTECGDIKYLLSLGVDPSKIIVCDTNRKALAAAKEFGVVISPHKNIINTIDWACDTFGSKNIASINVDLCATLFKGLQILSKAFSPKIHKNTKIFFTYRRGRDDLNSENRALVANGMLTIFRKEFNQFNYQSHTVESIGSPMCMVTM